VYFGGGTPGLFSNEYKSLFSLLEGRLASDTEISLEINPDNASKENFQTWRSVGFNRVSIGVQSMAELGLKALTRDHSVSASIDAIEKAKVSFEHVNADLIFGWPGQTLDSWQVELTDLLNLKPTHLSLYCLMFEGSTVFGKKKNRGLMLEQEDDALYRKYEFARKHLHDQGFIHEEVSNWGRPESLCAHNRLYWTQHHYIGIGSGAHGFIPNAWRSNSLVEDSQVDIGLRYQHSGDFRLYSKSTVEDSPIAAAIFDDRTDKDYVDEVIACSLRTREGFDLRILQKFGMKLTQNAAIERGFQQGALKLQQGRLCLDPSEWFREGHWVRELSLSIR
jgi:oxygen-independent coproporphyrinogen-3 oxidase